MQRRCANCSCSVPRRTYDGTVFRLDIELSDATGRDSRKSIFVWLCATCAAVFTPSVQVTDTSVRLLLSTRPGREPHDAGAMAN